MLRIRLKQGAAGFFEARGAGRAGAYCRSYAQSEGLDQFALDRCDFDQFDFDQFDLAFSAAAAGPLAGAPVVSGKACRAPPVKRSITERTASRALLSLSESSNCVAPGERRIRLSGSGKISGSSHGPCTTKGRSKLLPPAEAAVRLATPFRSYSRAGTEAVPVSVIRAAGPLTWTSSAVATPSANFTEM